MHVMSRSDRSRQLTISNGLYPRPPTPNPLGFSHTEHPIPCSLDSIQRYDRCQLPQLIFSQFRYTLMHIIDTRAWSVFTCSHNHTHRFRTQPFYAMNTKTKRQTLKAHYFTA